MTTASDRVAAARAELARRELARRRLTREHDDALADLVDGVERGLRHDQLAARPPAPVFPIRPTET